MTTQHNIGIDIGTSSIKIVITENNPSQEGAKILFNIEHPTQGFRNGYINDIDQVTESLRSAIKKAESVCGEKIKKAQFSIGGIGLSSQYVKASIDIERKTGEISDRDVEELIQKSEDLFTQKYPNKKILHIIPIKYRVNHRDVLGTPVGMYGNYLEAKIFFITVLEHHYDAYISVIENNNIDIEGFIAGPIADASVSLTYKQKIQGALLLNVGSETTSLSTFENGKITSLDVFPIGSSDITNDIALGLQVDLETAEQIKIQKNKDFPKRKVEEIMSARTADILELAEKHLLKIKKNRMLPAGVVFSGKGANIDFLENQTKTILRLPAATTQIFKHSKKTKRQTNIGGTFSVAYGLSTKDATPHKHSKTFSFSNIGKKIRYWFDQINP